MKIYKDVQNPDTRRPNIWERLLLRPRPRLSRISILLKALGFKLSFERLVEDGDRK